MLKRLHRFIPGEVLLAKWLDEMREALERLRVTVDPASSLELHQGSNGTAISRKALPQFWAKLTAYSGGLYTAVEQIRSGGSWVNGPRTVSAVEANGNASISVGGTIRVFVRYERESNEWIFQSQSC